MNKEEKEWVARETSYRIKEERKLNLFGHICRMEDSRLVKVVVFGEMEGKKEEYQKENGWTM